MNKKAQSTMTGVIIAILITLGLFYGLFTYTQANYVESGITETIGYNQSYADLIVAQGELSTQVDAIKNSTTGIVEANYNVALIAWNGLTGLAATIRLFVKIIDVGILVFDAIVPALSFFPPWLKILINIGILASLILIVIGAFKGETKS